MPFCYFALSATLRYYSGDAYNGYHSFTTPFFLAAQKDAMMEYLTRLPRAQAQYLVITPSSANIMPK